MGDCLSVPLPKDSSEITDYVFDPRHSDTIHAHSGKTLRLEVHGEMYKQTEKIIDIVLKCRNDVKDPNKTKLVRTEAACLLKNWYGDGFTDQRTDIVIVARDLKRSLYYAKLAAELTPSDYMKEQVRVVEKLIHMKENVDEMLVQVNTADSDESVDDAHKKLRELIQNQSADSDSKEL